MDNIELNKILNREELAGSLISTVHNIFSNRDNPLAHRGVYIYGSPGSGKTEFVMRTLKSCGFDVVRYDASDSRGKSAMETMTKQYMPEVNIMSMWNMKQKKIVLVMDDIEAMNSGDKGGINALMKLLRPKKTKKQQNEAQNYSPIVCISNRHVDKKIGDLMRVCVCLEIPTPSDDQIDKVVRGIFKTPTLTQSVRQRLVENVNGDLRKLAIMYDANRKGLFFDAYSFDNIFASSSMNEDAKRIVKSVINKEHSFKEHASMIGDADRTIVGLLWHENVIDVLGRLDVSKSIPIYNDILKCMCLGDYIDRNTFQKQVWQFNELSSIIKTMIGHHHYHMSLNVIRHNIDSSNIISDKKDELLTAFEPQEVRFTRVLTKYSSEFNNFTFIQTLCQKLGVDRSDLEHIFEQLKEQYEGQPTEAASLLANYDIGKQEVERMFKMLSYDSVKKTRKISRKNASKESDDDEELFNALNTYTTDADDNI